MTPYYLFARTDTGEMASYKIPVHLIAPEKCPTCGRSDVAADPSVVYPGLIRYLCASRSCPTIIQNFYYSPAGVEGEIMVRRLIEEQGVTTDG